MTTTLTLPKAGTWTIDASHSSVEFVVRHLMLAKVRGSFDDVSGAVTVGDSAETSSVEVEIRTASVNTRDGQRDGHLRSPDFFDVEQFPVIGFRSTAIRPEAGDTFAVDGELTVHGVTKPVVLEVTFNGVRQDPWGNDRIGFSAEAELDREAFGLTWNQALETGGVLVGKMARIEIEIEAVGAPAEG